MTLAGFVAYALALGIAAAVPGPGVVALVARALGAGFRHGMAFAGGLVLGDLTYLTAAVFGLSLVADMMGSLFVLVRYGGAAYLAWLAWRLWRAAGDPKRVAALTGERASRSFWAGLVVTLGNPKTIVFYMALVPTLVDLRHVTMGDYLVLVALTTAVLALVMTPYAALAARARGFLQRPAILARLNRSAALFLAGAAMWTVVRRP
ncbi:LysE family translocator [Aureimonas flava]|uniref:LysE family translocator n=1 Tax=Aureimonas flava TaxID=2320271 RepID=A0A3A1WLU4_9HYPH|nr:LysE family translocator [Aureimonas flava]RIY00821.1 LysE family translocator [Aureimonas flava]